jgi:gp16 family phage-associated protein
MASKPLTADQVKHRLRLKGVTITQWAADRGYTRNEVYRVLNGQAKAHYGKAHEIAVELGMKPDDSDAQPSTTAASRNTQQRAAA